MKSIFGTQEFQTPFVDVFKSFNVFNCSNEAKKGNVQDLQVNYFLIYWKNVYENFRTKVLEEESSKFQEMSKPRISFKSQTRFPIVNP